MWEKLLKHVVSGKQVQLSVQTRKCLIQWLLKQELLHYKAANPGGKSQNPSNHRAITAKLANSKSLQNVTIFVA